MMQITFAVYGEPVPKGRPRFSTRGKFPVAYTPEKTKNYELEVAMMAKAAMGASDPLEGALEAFIYVTCKFKRSCDDIVAKLLAFSDPVKDGCCFMVCHFV